ncbi:hypothetical protein MBLNU457_3688t2 [Dothideomycetes sp. NU457]
MGRQDGSKELLLKVTRGLSPPVPSFPTPSRTQRFRQRVVRPAKQLWARALVLNRRQKTVAGSLLIALTLLLLTGGRLLHLHLHRNPAPPAPFYCSTWDSAPAVSEEQYPGILHRWGLWAQYDHHEAHNAGSSLKTLHAAPPQEQTSWLSLSKDSRENKPKSMADSSIWKKPKGFKIVAMIFYGRPHLVDILDCYLQQNMVYNGGFLDEVHFIAHTNIAKDLLWLDNLVEETPGYERIEVGPNCHKHPNSEDCRYERIWERYASDEDTLYIKIDDDMDNSPPTWKPSELEIHPHDSNFQDLHFGPTEDTSLINSGIENVEALYEKFRYPPFPGHRWLPLSQNTTSLLYTPMSRATADPWGPGVHNWALAAQQHYSLLQNIENNTLHKYWIAPVPPLGTGMWNMQYTRYNLNFIAVWGKDIAKGSQLRRVSGPSTWDADSPAKHSNDTKIQKAWSALGEAWANGLVSNMHDDEKNITADMPRNLGRPMMLDVQALAAHMHFHDQEPGMMMTDMLDRWRAYANEKVCAPRRQKKVPGQENGLGWKKDNANPHLWMEKCPFVYW